MTSSRTIGIHLILSFQSIPIRAHVSDTNLYRIDWPLPVLATKRRKEESGDQKSGGDGMRCDDDDESQDVPEHALCHLEES